MAGSVVAALLVALVGLCCAHPHPGLEGGGVTKRDLEFNQYVPGYRLRGEPSCEELREMWRLSKREARRATTTNQLPRRTQHHTYGRLVPFAPEHQPRSSPVYGSTWIYPPNSHPTSGSFETLRSLLGPGDRRGSYNKLRMMVASSRGPNQSSKGSFDNLVSMVARERPEPRPLALSLRASKDTFPPRSKPPRREPAVISPRTMRGSMTFSHQGFVGPLLPADSRLATFAPWQPPAPDPAARACEEVEWSYCRTNADCACTGLYRCSKGRCKVSSKTPVVQDSMGAWYAGPVEAKDLGMWSKRR